MEQMDTPTAIAALKSRQRPQSRASTASIHSVTTQTNLDQSAFADASDMYSGQWMTTNHGQLKDDMQSGAPQMSPEAMIIHAATHLQSTGQDFTMDASMGASMNHAMAFQQKHPMARHPLPAEQYNASFSEGDSSMMARGGSQEDSPIDGMPGMHRPTSTRSSANNELEMRQLFHTNKHRSLQEIATELHGNERGPNSERNRQMFAMIWISQVCSKGKGSVPRGRVYANYASRCATERITVLNPASFGKLVRVLFPGLKTRRLGVRGESKYHYVNFALVDDQPSIRAPSPPPLRPLSEPNSFSQGFNTAPPQSSNNLTQTALPSPQVDTVEKASPVPAQRGGRSHSFYNQPDLASLDHLHTTSAKTQLPLAFPPENDAAFNQSDPLALPSIELYLPQGTDPDAAKSLSALYRSHCTSLVECIRFCREKTFFHLYTSFQGTLTMPVQKLFAHPALASWIEECDFVLYQQMMRILSGLTLQVCPKPVLDTLRNISERLVLHVRDSFQGQPQHVIQAKEAPAAIFAGLLDRLLRVNLTAHAAANMLSNPANRDQMYLDWITMIRPRKIAECVPTRGMDDVVNMLLTEMRDLLDPVKIPWEVECLTIYGDAASRSGRPTESGDSSESSGHNVLDRWVTFLRGLPTRFSYASHADIVWCVERVGTSVMRDITLSGGKSFGTWWVTKTWLDEMVCFLAEQGGFIKMKSAQNTKVTPQPRSVEKETSRRGSQYQGNTDDLGLSNMSQAQPGRAPFPTSNINTNPNQGSTGAPMADIGDDSGIGIRTPEEEFPMDKYEFTGTDNQGLMAGSMISAEAGL